MKIPLSIPAALFIVLIFMVHDVRAQSAWGRRIPTDDDELAFHKGCVVVSLTEGITQADYGISPRYLHNFLNTAVTGPHDPLFIEYGLSNEWGAGVSLSVDLFGIDPAKYGSGSTSGPVQVLMSDATLYFAHHYFVTRRLDLSGFTGFGISAVTINGKDGDSRYHYNSDGYIFRAGTRMNYYSWKGWGITAIASGFTNYNSSKSFKGNTFGKDYLTKIDGYCWELGVSYRFQ